MIYLGSGGEFFHNQVPQMSDVADCHVDLQVVQRALKTSRECSLNRAFDSLVSG